METWKKWAMFPHRYVVNSPLTIEQVDAVLKENLTDSWFPRMSGKLFRGKSSPGKFEIVRIIQYKNSFVPVFSGKLLAQGRGSRIEISAAVHPFVMVFLAAFVLGWVPVAGMGGIGFLYQLWTSGGIPPESMIVAAFPLMIMAIFPIFSLAFRGEIQKMLPLLENAFQAPLEEVP